MTTTNNNNIYIYTVYLLYKYINIACCPSWINLCAGVYPQPIRRRISPCAVMPFESNWTALARQEKLWVPRAALVTKELGNGSIWKPWVLSYETLSKEWYGPYLVTQWVVAWFNVLWRHLTAQIITDPHGPSTTQSRLASQSGLWNLCFGTVLHKSFPIAGDCEIDWNGWFKLSHHADGSMAHACNCSWKHSR